MKRKIIFIFFLSLFACVPNIQAQMRVHLINVGQGCATLIEFTCGAIIVDTGGESDTLYNSTAALKKYLDDFFTRRSDLNHTFQCVYLTHPHKDHTLGVPVILQPPYVIKNVVTDGLEQGSGKLGQIKLHQAAEVGDETDDPSDDIGLEAVHLDEIGSDGLTNAIIDPVNCTGTNPVIKVLWGTSVTKPQGWNGTDYNNTNNHSLVIKIEYGISSLLITGDLEDVAIKSLLAKYNGSKILDSDVYLVGHHGSKNGTTQELLDKISPKIALIGVGDDSRQINWTAWAYGHPNKGILDMLQGKLTETRTPIQVQAGTGSKKFVDYTITKAIYTTAWDDNVVLEADNAGHWINTETTIVQNLINVNTSPVSDLAALPGLGMKKAQAIVKYRTSNGRFSTLLDLDKVPGIGPATINLIRPYVMI